MESLSGLSYHKLNIDIAADAAVELRGWPGAVLRNNLLFAASQVFLSEGVSLLDWIDSCPLQESHPKYQDMRGGFPKAYTLFLHDPEYGMESRPVWQRGEKLSFSLVLIGKACRFYREFVEAVRLMCRRGMGHPMTSFTLLGISEDDCCGRRNRIAVMGNGLTAPLRYPVHITDFERENFGQVENVMRLTFDSPVLLAVPGRKKNRKVSYQDKMNAFPSFYQFVRSAVCRYMNLALLYGNDEGLSPYDVPVYGEEELDDFLEEAVSAMLLESSIRWVRIPGPLRKDGRQPMCFTGYMGQLVFAGDFSRYMPLLAFMQALGNGNDTVYGLGCYHFEILKYINKKQ